MASVWLSTSSRSGVQLQADRNPLPLAQRPTRSTSKKMESPLQAVPRVLWPQPTGANLLRTLPQRRSVACSLGVSYLGTWKNSGLHVAVSNAVYGSRDNSDRINRRISKETSHGVVVVVGDRYDTKRTACSHDDINYVANTVLSEHAIFLTHSELLQ